MADALVSAPVAIAAGAISVSMIALAAHRSRESRPGDSVALMGVMGAFVFVAQMINFSIPGTGSSGHIIGGILLAAMLGPWRGFLTLCSVLIVQCLVFADGGLLALGCNILNMGVMSCLVAYPLIYRTITRGKISTGRIMWASVLACIIGLELGAVLVCLETAISGISVLPVGEFMLFMLPIHFVIGACEGVATGLVLVFVQKRDPQLLSPVNEVKESKRKLRPLILTFLGVAVVLAGCFMWIASSNPDGLEWSIMKLTGSTELDTGTPATMGIMDGYDSHFAGIIGAVIVMAILWAISAMIFHGRRRQTKRP